MVTLCKGDSAALDLQAWPLRVLQQIIGRMVVGVGQLIALVLFLDGVDAGLVFPSLTTRVSAPALPRLVHAKQQGARGGAGETLSVK